MEWEVSVVGERVVGDLMKFPEDPAHLMSYLSFQAASKLDLQQQIWLGLIKALLGMFDPERTFLWVLEFGSNMGRKVFCIIRGCTHDNH